MAKFYLDTNALYLLAGVTVNDSFQRSDLLNLIGEQTDEIFISNLTIFEMLNNRHVVQQYNNLMSNLEKYSINVLADCDVEKFYSINHEKRFRELYSSIERENLRIEIGKYISWKYAENISLILQIIFTYYCGIPYFADFTNYDPFYFKFKQQITDISDSVGEYFIEASYKYLNEAIKCGFFQEKIVKEYIRESLSALALSIAPYFNEIISALNNNELTWEFAYSETQKWVESNPFEKLWTFKGDYTTLNLYQTSFKGNENIFDRMVKNYKLEEADPPYRTQFLRRYIASILKTNFSCNTNDFIDELIFELYSLFESDEFVCFVSLDKKFRNFLKTLNDKKFNASISFISLKTNKKM